MSEQFESEDSKKFTLTAFLSFAVVFVFLMLMTTCHGTYKKNVDPGTTEYVK